MILIICRINVVRRESNMRLGTTYGDCLLPHGHHNKEHLFMNPDGEYFIWADDFQCGCCDPETEDRCFYYEKISTEDAQALLTKRD